MALPDGLIIDVGTGPNTQTGDPLRTAYQKSNAADEYLDQNKANTSDVTPNGGNTTDTAQSLRDGIDENKTAIENYNPQLTSSDDSIKIQEEDITVNVDNFNLNTYFNNQINF